MSLVECNISFRSIQPRGRFNHAYVTLKLPIALAIPDSMSSSRDNFFAEIIKLTELPLTLS